MLLHVVGVAPWAVEAALDARLGQVGGVVAAVAKGERIRVWMVATCSLACVGWGWSGACWGWWSWAWRWVLGGVVILSWRGVLMVPLVVLPVVIVVEVGGLVSGAQVGGAGGCVNKFVFTASEKTYGSILEAFTFVLYSII